MRCQNELDPGRKLREARESLGLTQRRLAVRAGTSQDAISRIERGIESPTLERFAQLMLVMGQRPVLAVEPLGSGVQGDKFVAATTMTPAERLREAVSWNRMASQLANAGERARRQAHPATRRV